MGNITEPKGVLESKLAETKLSESQEVLEANKSIQAKHDAESEGEINNSEDNGEHISLVDPSIPPRFFKPCNLHCEYEELYKKGGFHPVKFGESFKDGRYVVFRKLGWATRSTVWLAEDKVDERFVVLKVTMADYSDEKTMEVTFEEDPELIDNPGAENLCIKLDSFTFEGPNGMHLVLVFEPLGRSFEEVIDLCSRYQYDPEYNPGKYGTNEWPAKFAREVCRQVTQGLDYLHAHKVMHRDIQPGNIILELCYNLDALSKDFIQLDVWSDKEGGDGDETTMSPEEWQSMNIRRTRSYMNVVERADGLPLEAGHPPYTVSAVSLHDRLEMGPPPPTNFTVRLIDLGSACKFEECNDGKAPYPLDIRAPEIVVKQPYNEKADIWALACTIFRIVTLDALIPLWMTSDKDATDDEHMKNIIDRFGKLPAFIREKWTRADGVIDAEGNIKNPDDHREDGCQFGDVWQGLQLGKPKDMGDAEAKSFHDLLLKMLDYDPAKRLSTEQVLEHPWFTTEEW